MTQISFLDMIDYGLAYVLAFSWISFVLWMVFKIWPKSERENKKLREETIKQNLLCVQTVEKASVCISQNTRALEFMQQTLEKVAHQEAIILEMQSRLHDDAIKCIAKDRS